VATGSIGSRGVDARTVPAALAQDAGEQAQLAGRAADLAGDAGFRESGFRDGTGDDVAPNGLDVGRDRLQELGALFRRRGSVGGEGRGGGGACGVDVGLVAMVVDGFEILAGAGIEGTHRRAGSVSG
jgi:hypothetical protein